MSRIGLNWAPPGMMTVGVTTGLNRAPHSRVADATDGFNGAPPSMMADNSQFELDICQQDGWCHSWFELYTSQQDDWCHRCFEVSTSQQDGVTAGLNWAPPNRVVGVTPNLNWAPPSRMVGATAGVNWEPPKYEAKGLKLQPTCRVVNKLLHLIHLACDEFYNALLHIRQSQTAITNGDGG